MIRGMIAAVALGALVSCGAVEGNECYSGGYRNVTSYEVSADRYTPYGIGLDDPRHLVDADEIDWQVDGLESCLNKNFAGNPIVSDEEAAKDNGWCLGTDFSDGISINRECIVVKVPDDLYVSECTGKILFPCDVDPKLCEDKNLFTPCDCNCRAMVQDGNYVITEPRLEVFRAELARIVTDCNNPWVVSQIRGCLNPYHED